MKALFDLNVLLDVFMNRSPWVTDSQAALQLVLDQKVVGCVSAISVTTLFYVCRRTVGRDQAMLVVTRCLSAFEIAAVDQAVLMVALVMPGADFEDRVQLASAQAAGAELIVTRHAGGFEGDALRAISPRAFVEETGATG